jgi:hypothetical protein
MAMTSVRRGAYSNLAGARLPDGPAPAAAVDCFRCAGARRVLREYAVGRHGKTIGFMRLCDGCAGDLIPLDPDPLDVTQPA